MSLRSWVAVGALAVASGTLVRLSLELGVPALRMLGFWCLVAIGLLAARAAARSQERAARRELAAVLARLGEEAGVRIAPAPGGPAGNSAGGMPPDGDPTRSTEGDAVTVIGPAAVGVLVWDGVADYARGPLVRRRLKRLAARAQALAAEAGRRAEAAGVAVPVRGAAVLLRRRPRPEEQAVLPVPLLNPEGVGAWVASALVRGEGLAARDRRLLLLALGATGEREAADGPVGAPAGVGD